MPNGSEFVDWDYMRKHEEKASEGFTQLGELQAEVMGDERTGRLSLRMELGTKVDEAMAEMRKTRATIWKSAGAIMLGLVLKAIFDYAVLAHIK